MLTPIEKIRIKQWDERKSDHDDDLMSLGAVRMLLDAKEAEPARLAKLAFATVPNVESDTRA